MTRRPAAAVLAALALPGTAAAWTPAATLAPPGEVMSPTLVATGAGAVAVWGSTRPVARFPGVSGTVTASPVRADGTAGPPVTLSPPGEDALVPVTVPAAGAPVTLWTRVPARATAFAQLEAAVASPDAPGRATPVPGTRGRVVQSAAGGADGTLALVTAAAPPATGDAVHVRRPDGAWEPARAVGAAGAVAVAPDGTVAVLAEGARVHVRRPDGAWERAAALGRRGATVTELRLAAGPEGTLVAAWTEVRPRERVLLAAARPPGGAFAPARVLARRVYGFALAAEPRGISAAWGEAGGIRVARRAGGAGWSAPAAVEATGPLCVGAAPDAIAGAPDGSVVVAWPMLGAVRAARGRPDGAWAAPVAVAGTRGAVTWLGAAAGPAGVTTLAWSHAGRLDARGILTERIAASTATGDAAGRPGVRGAVAPRVRRLAVTAGPGGRLVVRVALRRPGLVRISIRLAQGPAPLRSIPVRLRGRAGANAVTVTVPPALRGRAVWVEAAPAAQPTCPVELRVRARRDDPPPPPGPARSLTSVP